MENTVTMRLKDYDELKDDINYYRNNIKEMEKDRIKELKEMEKDRIKELKEIFKLRECINDIDIKIDYGNIVKELYGAEIKIDDGVYKINKDKDCTEIVYNIWKKEE